MDHDRKILQMPCFRGKTCFDIAHSKECAGLWVVQGMAGRTAERQGEQVQAPAYSVHTSHPIYKHLIGEYGLSPKKRRKLGASDEGAEEEEKIDEEKTEEGGEKGAAVRE